MLTNDEDYTTILSLGGLCQVAYQIEQRFGFRINSPFDWLVTPLASIAKILSDDGAMLGKSIQVHNYGTSAVCNHYGVAYQHDFPRNAERRISTSAIRRLCSGKSLTGPRHKKRRPKSAFS